MFTALATASAQAQELSLEPVTLTMATAERSSSIWVTNLGAEPLRIATRVFRWQQRDGDEVLTPTAEVAISPPAVDVAPGVRQRLRVVRLTAAQNAPASPAQESYRIIVDGHPPQPSESAMRYSLPLFIGTGVAQPAMLQVCIFEDGARQTQLRIQNQGERHAKLVDLRYLPPQGPALPLISDLAGYVLPESYKHWQLDGALQTFASGRFAASVNGEEHHWPSRFCAQETAQR